MYNPFIRPLIFVMLVLLMIITTGIARADKLCSTTDASAEAIATDALVARPLGLAATLLGTAIFIVSLPFSLPSKSSDEAAHKLIAEPATYTFARPLGQTCD